MFDLGALDLVVFETDTPLDGVMDSGLGEDLGFLKPLKRIKISLKPPKSVREAVQKIFRQAGEAVGQEIKRQEEKVQAAVEAYKSYRPPIVSTTPPQGKQGQIPVEWILAGIALLMFLKK